MWCTLVIFLVVYNIKEPGPTNPYYPIGTYTGSRYRERYVYAYLLEDKPIMIAMTKDICYNDKLVYISIMGTIRCINTTSNIIYIINVNGNTGYLDGDINHAMFSDSLAIAFYQYNSSNSKKQAKPVVITQITTECIYANKDNYSSCENTLIKNDSIIDPKKLIFIDTYDSTLRNNEVLGSRKLYIADTNNHCIRVIDLEISTKFIKTKQKQLQENARIRDLWMESSTLICII
jgi:hypothetical protein